jgi:hypothetical protein
MFFFFLGFNFVILSHWWSNAQGDLATFGYRLALKVNFLKTLLYLGYLLKKCVETWQSFRIKNKNWQIILKKNCHLKTKCCVGYAWIIVWALRQFTIITWALRQFLNVRPNENYDIPIFCSFCALKADSILSFLKGGGPFFCFGMTRTCKYVVASDWRRAVGFDSIC